MTQSQFEFSPRAKVAHHAVPESSREAYHEASKCWRENAVRSVLRTALQPMTAAEIADSFCLFGRETPAFRELTLNMRRALSDIPDGIGVETRPCRITGRKVIAWRLAKP